MGILYCFIYDGLEHVVAVIPLAIVYYELYYRKRNLQDAVFHIIPAIITCIYYILECNEINIYQKMYFVLLIFSLIIQYISERKRIK